MDQPLPFLTDGYRIPKAKKRLAMKIFDRYAATMCLGMRRNFAIEPPEKILIANAGHLGDLIMTTAIIPVLRATFPFSQIGVLTGSWSKACVERHPEIQWVHLFDHVLLDRSGSDGAEKRKRHFASRATARKEVRAIGYDVAIDVRFNPGNYFQFLARCGIPARIGFTCGGSGPFLTHPVQMDERHLHVTDRFFELCQRVGVQESARGLMRTSMPPYPPEFIPADNAANGRYVVLHPGAHDKFKEWDVDAWRLLAKRLESDGLALVLTGSGDGQHRLAEQIRLGVPSVRNLVGSAGWWDYVHLIEHAHGVICVDTVAQHIAAAVGTPVVALMPGIVGYQWSPFGPRCLGLTDKVECVPCHRSAGCEGMECIRNLDAQRVHAAFRDLISQ